MNVLRRPITAANTLTASTPWAPTNVNANEATKEMEQDAQVTKKNEEQWTKCQYMQFTKRRTGTSNTESGTNFDKDKDTRTQTRTQTQTHDLLNVTLTCDTSV